MNRATESTDDLLALFDLLGDLATVSTGLENAIANVRNTPDCVDPAKYGRRQ